jgi:DNA polymerase-3 subunit epsilon
VDSAWLSALAVGTGRRLSAALGSIVADERNRHEHCEEILVTDQLPLWASDLAVFDTETTGVDTSSARIVSATIALLGPSGEVAERYDWLLDPGIEIPLAAVQVHGISTEIARTSGIEAAVGVQQIVTQLLEMIERGFPVVAYNAPFDLSLLAAEAARHGIALPAELSPVIDPLILDKQFHRYRKGKRTLEAVAAHHGVEIGNAHDAGDDAIAAGRVLQRIARKYADVIPQELEELHRSQVEWAAAQAASFQEYMRRVRDPSFIADGRWPVRAG